MVRIFLAATTLTLVYAGALAPAMAQVNVPQPITTPDGQKSTPRGRRTVEQPPSAIPGSRAEPGLNERVERSGIDMPPTEALFDAINRGDVVGAREAIGRGADINGRNVLGLTPVEQAVDLGRNDISFLLLSLQSGAGYKAAGGPRPADTPDRSAAASRTDRRLAAQEAARARREQLAETRAARGPVAPAPARNARLFAGDGGAPVPQAGFLGFDTAR